MSENPCISSSRHFAKSSNSSVEYCRLYENHLRLERQRDALAARVAEVEADARRWQIIKKDFSTLGLDMGGNHSWLWRGNPARLKGPTIDAAVDGVGLESQS